MCSVKCKWQFKESGEEAGGTMNRESQCPGVPMLAPPYAHNNFDGVPKKVAGSSASFHVVELVVGR